MSTVRNFPKRTILKKIASKNQFENEDQSPKNSSLMNETSMKLPSDQSSLIFGTQILSAIQKKNETITNMIE